MSTYRDELFKATEANISDVKSKINDLMNKLSTLERLKNSYTLALTDEDIRIVDDQISNEKKLTEKALRKINRENKKLKSDEEKKKDVTIKYRENEYVLSILRESFRKLANREKRNGTGENVLDMKAHITYDSLHKNEIRYSIFNDSNLNTNKKDITNCHYDVKSDSQVLNADINV